MLMLRLAAERDAV